MNFHIYQVCHAYNNDFILVLRIDKIFGPRNKIIIIIKTTNPTKHIIITLKKEKVYIYIYIIIGQHPFLVIKIGFFFH